MNEQRNPANSWAITVADDGPFIRRLNPDACFESDVHAFRYVLDTAKRSQRCQIALDLMVNENPEGFYDTILEAADKSETFYEENSILVGILDLLWNKLSREEKIACAKKIPAIFRDRIRA